MKEPPEPPSGGGREETPFPFAGSRFSGATGLSQGCPGEGTRPHLTSCPSSQVHGRARRTRDPAPCVLRRARRLGRAHALGLRASPGGPGLALARGEALRWRPTGHRAPGFTCRALRSPDVLASARCFPRRTSLRAAGRRPVRGRAWPSCLLSIVPAWIAAPAASSPPLAQRPRKSRAVHLVTALRIHLSSVILWKMDTLHSPPQQHSLRDKGEQSILPGTRRRDRGPLRGAAPDSPARTQGFVQASWQGGCTVVAFPRVGPVGVTFPPSRCRYHDPLENRTKTRDVECRPGQEIS